MTSKIAERVAAIYTDTNQQVHKGQLLIQLDDRDERARLAQALAGLHAQQETANAAQQNVQLTQQTVQAQTQEGNGGIASAQSGIVNAEQQVAVAVQGVAQARAQLSAAQAAVPAAAEALAKANADFQRTLGACFDGRRREGDPRFCARGPTGCAGAISRGTGQRRSSASRRRFGDPPRLGGGGAGQHPARTAHFCPRQAG